MGSVRKIAQRVGVSPATVSRVLNNSANVDPQTRDRVLAAANISGYSPTIGRRLTTVVGLVYPGEPVSADYGAFESALLAGILRGLNDQKFDLKIISVQRDKIPGETYTQFFIRKGLRGVILRTFAEARRECEAIAEEQFPAVVVADRFDNPAVNFICCDSRADSERAVSHLLDLGHRRIGLVVHRVADTDHVDRRAGYEAALKARGLTPSDELRVEIVASMEGGATAINRLLSLPQPPTAVFFTDPLATVGALRKCQELSVKVPQDLSIVGFDDSDIRQHTFPAFTAVCQDAGMLGFEAARWLSRMVSGQADPRVRLIRPTMLEINHTTAAPPAEVCRVLPDGTRLPAAGHDGASVTPRVVSGVARRGAPANEPRPPT
jgi:DNA-binding LacI/PurR family transcriptional regulator